MLKNAFSMLRDCFVNVKLSPVYKSKAVGFNGEDFYNAVARCFIDRGIYEVNDILHKIQLDLDPQAACHKNTVCKIDLDLLIYDNVVVDTATLKVPRPDIIDCAHVLKPLVDIAADEQHPVLCESYQQIWDKFYLQNAADLQEIKFDFY